MAELPTITLALYAQTDTGMVRSGNEDNFLILDLSTAKSWTASEEEPQELLTYTQDYYGSLLAVSDGMGGALAGEVASRMAVETVRDRMLQLQAHKVLGQLPFHERLRLSIEEANLLINSESQTNPAHKGLGATFTAVATQGNQIYFAQVGDSRAYLIRDGQIFRVTKDQSLVQQLIDAGQITEEEAETHSYRNVILQALGAHNNINVEVNYLTLCQLDTLVVCSDGLSGKMHQDEIARIVYEASDFKSACESLVYLANERGGEDNITVVVAQFSGAGLPEPGPDPFEALFLPRSPETPTEIDWGVGDETELPEPPPELMDETEAESAPTESLSAPPTQSTPFTAKAQRQTADMPRTNDLSDRRGPITSVFAAFDDDSPLTPSQQAASAVAPAEQRQAQTLPVQLDGDEAAAAASSLNLDPGPTTGLSEESETPPAKNGSWTNFFILTSLLMLGVVGVVVGVTSYLSYIKGQEQERSAREEAQQKLERENQSLKDGKIGQLREKIAEISKKLEASDKPAVVDKREQWREQLKKLTLQLDEAAKIPPDQQQQIEQNCDQVRKELQTIEDEVNNRQGLLPSQTNRRPVKV
ncbi:MAG TPA: protein phosphatase 2C domain-containing protein [Blastocatellia bacterium]|nr:protein phosphatase 2C domain-containing protein [Blastocatellia bacterium]